MKQYCYINGKIIETNKAALPIMDIAILRGYAVFDVLRTYNGQPFLWDLHWGRLVRSAKALDIDIPISSAEALAITRKLHKKNILQESNIRILISGGISEDGFTKSNKASVVILVTPFHDLPKEFFTKGAKLLLHEHLRDEYRSKTTNYITSVKMKAECVKKGALEILYYHQGKVLECATSNFFIVKNKVIITPKDNILVGITRNLVIQLAKDNNFKILEKPILLKDIKKADEAFLTATNKDIVPITKIDSFKVGNGKVGTVTKQLMDLFEDYITSL